MDKTLLIMPPVYICLMLITLFPSLLLLFELEHMCLTIASWALPGVLFYLFIFFITWLLSWKLKPVSGFRNQGIIFWQKSVDLTQLSLLMPLFCNYILLHCNKQQWLFVSMSWWQLELRLEPSMAYAVILNTTVLSCVQKPPWIMWFWKIIQAMGPWQKSMVLNSSLFKMFEGVLLLCSHGWLGLLSPC